jgi:hypothetical protein
MNNDVAATSRSWIDPEPRSLDASDEFDELTDPACYCPLRLLAAFSLLMSGHGRCVNTGMMLGDREYAIWQLARAHTLDDAELREITVKLFGYFDDERIPTGRLAVYA